MRMSTRDDSARPRVKTHYEHQTLHDTETQKSCDTYSELPLELRERVQMNPIHCYYDGCMALHNTYLHLDRCYYGGIERLARRLAARNTDLPEAAPNKQPLIHGGEKKK